MNRAFKIARIQAGLTQQHLAREAGVSEATITRVETGRVARLAIRTQLARILGKTVGELFPVDAKGREGGAL